MRDSADVSALRQLSAAGLVVYDAFHRAQTYTAAVQQLLARAEELLHLASLAYLPDPQEPLPIASTGAARPQMIAAYVQAQQAFADLKDSLYRLAESSAQAGAYAEALRALDALIAIEPGYRDAAARRPWIEFRQRAAAMVDAGYPSRALKIVKQWQKEHPDSMEAALLESDVMVQALRREANARQQPDLIVALGKDVTMAFRPVPAGEFQMGDDRKWVEVGGFWIGKYPVTVAQFKAFVRATGYSCGSGALRDVDKFGDHPVCYVSWGDAQAFCEWASQVSGKGIRLPTEAEWEKAARGVDGRVYPWGEGEPDGRRCNFGEMVGGTTSVGRYSPGGDSPYGCVDMAGNVWEWTASQHESGGYVLRGGSWNVGASIVRCTSRNWSYPVYRDNNLGFRCAC